MTFTSQSVIISKDYFNSTVHNAVTFCDATAYRYLCSVQNLIFLACNT